MPFMKENFLKIDHRKNHEPQLFKMYSNTHGNYCASLQTCTCIHAINLKRFHDLARVYLCAYLSGIKVTPIFQHAMTQTNVLSAHGIVRKKLRERQDNK